MNHSHLLSKFMFGLGALSLSAFGQAQSSVGAAVNLNGVDLPRSMGNLGDSISAAALANYSRQDATLELFQFIPFATLYGTTQQFVFVEAPGYSWSEGMDLLRPVNSHAHRLTDLRGGQALNIHKSAVSGQASSNVANNQITDLMTWSLQNLGQQAPDYVTILIGANDICNANTLEQMTSPSDYEANVDKAVDLMLANSPRTKILISTIPAITTLPALTANSTLFTETGTAAGTCAEFWKNVYSSTCPLIMVDNGAASLAQVTQRVADYNLALQDIVRKRSAQFGDRIPRAARSPPMTSASIASTPIRAAKINSPNKLGLAAGGRI